MVQYIKSFLNRKTAGQFFRLSVIGVVNTFVDFGLLNVFRWVLGWSVFWSIAVAFGVATFSAYVMNRRWTFGLSDGLVSARETARFFTVGILAWVVTEAIVLGADAAVGPLGVVGLNAAKLLTTGLILFPKFASYRDLVFRDALRADRN